MASPSEKPDQKIIKLARSQANPSVEEQGGLPPTNLPVAATAFIGRAALVNEIHNLILAENVRVLTLTGPGGVGKTRVALKACEMLLPEFEDGVFFVNLAPVSDPGLVVGAIASTLGVKESGSTPLAVTLANYLSDRGLVLLLDNFEQVVSAGPSLTRLIAGAPGVRLVITSRTPLRLYGEYEYQIPPMDLPDDAGKAPLEEVARSESIRLFVERGSTVRPGFSLTQANAQTVARICQRLDGLPLAMELAAARLRLFSPSALLARLDKALSLLTGGPRDLPARQQTLRGAIDWSYNLLSDIESELFALMSVFVGGCTLDEVQSLCAQLLPELQGDALVDRLDSLVAQNLLRQREQEDGEPRFWLLATIHEYALEKLSESGRMEEAQRAHARLFLELVEAAGEVHTKGSIGDAWLLRIDREYPNLRASLRRSLDSGESEVAARIAVVLDWFWQARGYLVEGVRWLDEILTRKESLPTPLRARALWSAAWLATSQNDFARTKVFAEESLDIYRELGDKVGTAKVLSHLGIVAAEQEDYSLALSRFEQSLDVWRDLGHTYNVSMLMGNMCFLALYEGNYERAIKYGEESLSIQRTQGNSLGLISTGINLGLAMLHAGKYTPGLELLTEMLGAAESVGSKRDIALCHHYLGLGYALQNNGAEAGPHFRESVSIFEGLGSRFGIARSLVGIAAVAAGEGKMHQAAVLSGAARSMIQSAGGKLVPAETELDRRAVKRASEQMGDSAFEQSRQQGQAMTQDRSIAVALGHEDAPASSHVEARPDNSAEPAPPVTTEASAGELSAREISVLRLVAVGLTNKEIAERLHLSHRTVEAHLYSVFNKLNITTRTAAIHYMTEHGLGHTVKDS